MRVASQQSPFYAALPEEAAASLEANWQKAGIAFQKALAPKPFNLSRLPAHVVYHFTQDLVFDATAVIPRLRRLLASTLLEGEVCDLKVRDQVVEEVVVQVGREKSRSQGRTQYGAAIDWPRVFRVQSR
jgi:hypothetical protein